MNSPFIHWLCDRSRVANFVGKPTVRDIMQKPNTGIEAGLDFNSGRIRPPVLSNQQTTVEESFGEIRSRFWILGRQYGITAGGW
jgi:hypothetical protein